MEKKKKYIVIFSVLLLIILMVSIGKLTDIKSKEITKPIKIERGLSTQEIAEKLKQEEIIKNPYTFLAIAYISGKNKTIQAGEYLLSSQMSTGEIIKILTSGDTIKEKLTIIEGWNLEDFSHNIQDKKIASIEDVYFYTGIPKSENTETEIFNNFEFLESKPKNLSLEGYLFPDTYYLDKNSEIKDILNKILSNFDRKLTKDLREEIKKQGKTIFEIITMASIIEKEVKTLEDKKIISGILWKRLDINMPLQVDATVLYALEITDNKVYKKYTEIDSPYNTYKYRGLPLGPISNPGIDSIMAAIYPIKTNYLYYLSTREGKTIFSKTLDEHNYNKAKYLN